MASTDDDSVAAVTQEEVFAFFQANVGKVRNLLFRAVAAVPTERACGCRGDSRLPRRLTSHLFAYPARGVALSDATRTKVAGLAAGAHRLAVSDAITRRVASG